MKDQLVFFFFFFFLFLFFFLYCIFFGKSIRYFSLMEKEEKNICCLIYINSIHNTGTDMYKIE